MTIDQHGHRMSHSEGTPCRDVALANEILRDEGQDMRLRCVLIEAAGQKAVPGQLLLSSFVARVEIDTPPALVWMNEVCYLVPQHRCVDAVGISGLFVKLRTAEGAEIPQRP